MLITSTLFTPNWTSFFGVVMGWIKEKNTRKRYQLYAEIQDSPAAYRLPYFQFITDSLDRCLLFEFLFPNLGSWLDMKKLMGFTPSWPFLWPKESEGDMVIIISVVFFSCSLCATLNVSFDIQSGLFSNCCFLDLCVVRNFSVALYSVMFRDFG